MSKYQGRIITDLAPAGYSVYFDGSNDRLIIANTSSAFPTGTQEFTLEFWAYKLNAWNTNDQFLFQDSATAGLQVWVNTAGGIFRVGSLGVAGIVDYAYSNLSINTWTHFAISRKVNSWALWVNGTRVATATYSSGLSSAVGTQTIGGASGSASWNGYISNVRIVRGTTVYDPASTTINVPTQLFVVPSTTLLTCNSPAIVDQSNNAFAITVNDNAAVSTLTPFTAYVPYNPALGASTPGVWTVDEAMQAAATRQWNMYDPYFNLTTLLLHGNGANNANNNTFLDSSSNNFTITRNGNTTQGSFSPFSQTGWSNYFDGSGDYLQLSSNAAFSFGTSDFTIEAWFYSATLPTLSAGGDGIFTAIGSVGLYVASDGIRITQSGTAVLNDVSTSILTNTWYHLALTRTGTSMRVFLNGIQVGATLTNSTNFSNTGNVRIGTETNQDFDGYISNLRVLKGTAQYTANFTPSTTPLTAITNTSLLTCQSNRFIDNSANAFAITVNGTPSVQPFSPFYPTAAYTPQTIGGSGYLDGSGDSLVSASLGASIGTGDYCLEAWVYTTNAATSFVSSVVLNNSSGYIIYVQISANTVRFLDFQNPGTNFIIGGGTINSNEWVHIVATRQSGNMRAFVNGRLAAYQASVNFNYGTAGTVEVPPSVAQYVSGVRVNIGSVPTSYQTSSTTTGTQIFTPPTAPTTTTSQGATAGNVSLLLNMTNAGIVDSTGDNVLETRGNASISTTVSRFGGSSIAFDGSGDFLLSNNLTLSRLSGNFTIEAWVYLNSVSITQPILCLGDDSTPTGVLFYVSSAGKVSVFSNNAAVLTGSGTVTASTWAHIAYVRSGSTITAYLNGVSQGSGTSSTVFTGTTAFPLLIGREIYIGVSGGEFNGYIDDFRLTNGFARYTGNFTPQTSQWQDQ